MGDGAAEIFAFPLSFAQQRLWFLDRLEPGSSAYNVPLVFRLTGDFRRDAFVAALNALVERHEVLRTTFDDIAGEPRQLVHRSLPVVARTVDVRTAADTEAAARDYIVDEVRGGFDLARDAAIRCLVVQCADDEHIVAVTLHHIVTDGWSMGIISRELAEFYGANVEGRPATLEPLPLQYADFAVWQHELMTSGGLHTQLDYWRKQLSNAPALIQLPIDRPRPAVQTQHGDHCREEYPAALLAALKALGQSQGATLQMTLLAAFGAVLHRISGQPDVCVGVPIAARTQPDLEAVVGFFTNTLVLRVDAGDDPTFRTLLEQTRDTMLDAHANQDLPFEKLVEELKPERSTSYSPLFQVMLDVRTGRTTATEFVGVSREPYEFERHSAKFDLSANFSETAGGLRASIEYNTDLFDATSIERLLGQVRRFLEGAVANPDERISRIELLTDAERRLLVDDWNATARNFSHDATVDELISRQAARTPDAVAVCAANRSVTYRELDETANRLAHHLRSIGVERGSLVGVHLDRSIAMVETLLAIIKAGGAYVPLDPGFPPDRLALMIEDSGLQVVVTEQSLDSALRFDDAIATVFIDRDRAAIDAQPPTPVGGVRDARDLMYVIYTSGSTGRPKGVMLEHRSVVNFLESMAAEPGLRSTDRLLAVTTLSFDIAGLELYLPLIVGATTVIASRDATLDPMLLRSALRDHHITVMQATPATWRMLVDDGWDGDEQLKILCGGEALPEALANELMQRGGEVWNMYGPTETTIWSTVQRVAAGAPVSIGRPIANTTLYVLDGAFQPQPIGVAGELLIGGEGLARGYHALDDLTAERFIADPFSPGGRLYRTGDLVRYRGDGSIEFLGRLDNQVKIRGFRIELGEIETALERLPAVDEAIVLARPDDRGEPRLVAYVVLDSGGAPAGTTVSTNDLRHAVHDTLPYYMVPSLVQILEAMPRTPNGKTNRLAMPAPDWSSTGGDVPYREPRDETERRIVHILERLLSRQPISIDDDFFDLGGHSLLAVRLVSQIEKSFGIRMPLMTLFHSPTAAGLADVVRGDRAAPSWDSLVPMRAEGSRPPLFCVHDPSGEPLVYRDLVRHLGDDQPVYGVQARGADRRHAPRLNLGVMADAYVDDILAAEPDGPYLLTGFCMGGVLAYETAIRLAARGADVRFVGLIDSVPFGHTNTRSKTVSFRLTDNLRRLPQMRWRRRISFVLENIRDGAIRYSRPVWWWIATKFFYPRDKALPRLLHDMEAINFRVSRGFVTGRYVGHVHVYGGDYGRKDLRQLWDDVALGGADFTITGGEGVGHLTLLKEPHVRDLAAKMRQAIDNSLDSGHDEAVR